MSIFPKEVVEKIEELGYSALAVIDLGMVWSVIGLKGERKFSIHLGKDLSVDSICLLRYRYNQWGSRVSDVERVLIQPRNQR